MELLKRRYQVDLALLHLESREGAAKEALRQAKYDLRQAEAEKLEYEGSFHAFLDKFSGKQEEKRDALALQVSRRKAALTEAQGALQRLEEEKTRLEAEDRELPPGEVFSRSEDSGIRTLWAEYERNYCIDALLPLLEENLQALITYRETRQGAVPGQILSHGERQQIYGQPDILAKQCKLLLERLETALELQGGTLEIGEYFRQPESYLVSPAASHNRMDRVNRAIDQVVSMRRTLVKMKE